MAGDPGIARRIVPTERGDVQPEHIGDPPMEQSATGQAGRPVDQVPDGTVREVVAHITVGPVIGRPDQAATRQHLDRLDDLVLGPAARLAQGRQLERPADRGGRAQDLRREAVDVGQPLLEHGADAGRHAAGCRGTVGERLRDVQRQPFGGPPQVVGRGRTVIHRDRCDEGAHVLEVEPVKGDDRVPGDPGRKGRDRPRRVVELLGPPREDDRQATTNESTDEVGQGPERGVIRPMQVVDDEQAGLLATERRLQPGRDRREEPRLGHRTGRRPALRRRVQAGNDRGERGERGRVQRADPRPEDRVAQRRAQGIDEWSVRDPSLHGVGPRRQGSGTVRASPLEGRLDQPGLADAGLADDHDDATIGRRADARRVDDGQRPITTDER